MKKPGKEERQEAIAQILGKNSIESQEELLQLLSDKGFELTQATLSRDFREMNWPKRPMPQAIITTDCPVSSCRSPKPISLG